MSERIRVRDNDTGHERTIAAHLLPHGNYEVLTSAAVDPRTGEDVPPVFGRKPAEKPAEPAPPRDGVKETGHKATNDKES